MILSGLAIDVIGAAVIALPDIPQLRSWHRAGRVRDALETMALGKLPVQNRGQHEFVSYLYEIADESPPEDLKEVNRENYKEGPYPDRFLLLREKHDPDMLEGIPFSVGRLYVDNQVRKREAYIRGIGFLVLATGFGLQMVGQFY